MPDMAKTSQYDEDFITALQWTWGDGYLAPGGAEEVAELLRDAPVAGRKVLDVGSGLGVIGVELVSAHGASSVVGIDVEEHLVRHSRQRAADAGLAGRVRFQLVEPGQLPFADGSFDAVFSKDAIVHIPDKASFYDEVLRVLPPGGLFVGSDWLRGGEETWSPVVDRWISAVQLDFEMKNLAQTHNALTDAGFVQVKLRDRNDWYRGEMENELAALSGERFNGLSDLIGRDKAKARVEGCQLKKHVIDQGYLRPTHFACYKPN